MKAVLKSRKEGWPFEIVKEVRQLHKKKMQVKRISRYVGVPVETIRDWLYRNKRLFK